jgi:osmotically-inducible protein OsmY
MVNNDSLWGEYPNDPYYGSGAFDIDIRAGAGSSAPNYAGRGPRNYRRSDESIREDVNEHLTRNPQLDASDIEVVVDNGEVTLHGEVADRHAKHLAEDIADDVSGVSDVHNHLKVRHGLMDRIRHAL